MQPNIVLWEPKRFARSLKHCVALKKNTPAKNSPFTLHIQDQGGWGVGFVKKMVKPEFGIGKGNVW